MVRVCVWSAEDPTAVVDVPGWHYVERPNQPLSDKWNAGSLALKDLSVDAMLIFGSDDLLNAEYINAAANLMIDGADYVMPTSIYFCTPEGRGMYCPFVGRIGGGRMVSRSILNQLHWRAWESGYRKNIDGCMDRELIRIGYKHPAPLKDIRSFGGLLMGVKLGGSSNMHSFDKLKRGLDGEDVDFDWLMSHLPEQVQSEITA